MSESELFLSDTLGRLSYNRENCKPWFLLLIHVVLASINFLTAFVP